MTLFIITVSKVNYKTQIICSMCFTIEVGKEKKEM